jgi:hypothetical protein
LRVDRIAAVYSAFTLLKELREKDAIPSAAEMVLTCEYLGLKGIYPFTGEPYSHAYYRVLYADLLPSYKRGDSTLYNLNFPNLTKGCETSSLSAVDFALKVNREVTEHIQAITQGRCIFISKKGYLSISPKAA